MRAFKKAVIISVISFPLLFYGCEKQEEEIIPLDGRWQGDVMSSERVKGISFTVENNGKIINDFYLSMESGGWGISKSNGWTIKYDNTFKMTSTYSAPDWDFVTEITGEFTSSTTAEGEYDMGMVYSDFSDKEKGTWTAKWDH